MERNSKPIVFFDFDNTIAQFDVFDELVKRFSKDTRWIQIEEQWKQGKIGSKECLEGQLRGLGVTKKTLDSYLSRIRLDPYFKKLLALLRKKRIRVFVLSDNFDYILKRVLRHNGVTRLKVYSNIMRFTGGAISPRFPFRNKKCPTCAHCKTKNLLANAGRNNIIIYIGDGRSDICPAQKADVIFAKDSLLRYCRQKKLAHIPFRNLKKVQSYFLRRFR